MSQAQDQLINQWGKIINALDDLDNFGFNNSDCALIFHFGTNDNSERYVDAEFVEGYVSHANSQLAMITGPEDLIEAIRGLAETAH